MDYKQKYEQALERAKMYQGMNVLPAESMIEIIFPELKEEREDERIRKKVIEVLKLNIKGAESQMQASRGVDRTFEVYACNKVISWFEKQGEQKPVEWSAYDKATLEYIIEDIKEFYDNETEECSIEIYNREINLLQAINESIKLSSYTNPAAWSEEDEKLYTWCASAIQTRYNDGLFTMDEYRETSLWLKSLKERMKEE